MKKLIAVFLTITLPIWYIPAFIIVMFGSAFGSAYKAILEALNELPKK